MRGAMRPPRNPMCPGRETDNRFQGKLELDLGEEPKARGLREFWVLLKMVNGSGIATGTSNTLGKLAVEARAGK